MNNQGERIFVKSIGLQKRGKLFMWVQRQRERQLHTVHPERENQKSNTPISLCHKLKDRDSKWH